MILRKKIAQIAKEDLQFRESQIQFMEDQKKSEEIITLKIGGRGSGLPNPVFGKPGFNGSDCLWSSSSPDPRKRLPSRVQQT
jgi:hypothetical protein